MGRLVSEHFKRDGLPKKGMTRKQATEAMKSHPEQRMYKCGFCGKYHLGKVKV